MTVGAVFLPLRVRAADDAHAVMTAAIDGG